MFVVLSFVYSWKSRRLLKLEFHLRPELGGHLQVERQAVRITGHLTRLVVGVGGADHRFVGDLGCELRPLGRHLQGRRHLRGGRLIRVPGVLEIEAHRAEEIVGRGQRGLVLDLVLLVEQGRGVDVAAQVFLGVAVIEVDAGVQFQRDRRLRTAEHGAEPRREPGKHHSTHYSNSPLHTHPSRRNALHCHHHQTCFSYSIRALDCQDYSRECAAAAHNNTGAGGAIPC